MIYRSPERIVGELDQLGSTALVAERDQLVGIIITIALGQYYRKSVEAFWIVQDRLEMDQVEVVSKFWRA